MSIDLDFASPGFSILMCKKKVFVWIAVYKKKKNGEAGDLLANFYADP